MKLFEEYATGPAVITVVLLEVIAVSWFYGELAEAPVRVSGSLPVASALKSLTVSLLVTVCL